MNYSLPLDLVVVLLVSAMLIKLLLRRRLIRSLEPTLRLEWWLTLPLIVIAPGYTLYGNYRERRRRRDASHGPVTATDLV
jgi:hypothetical protein